MNEGSLTTTVSFDDERATRSQQEACRQRTITKNDRRRRPQK
jgi:hypothetical protein